MLNRPFFCGLRAVTHIPRRPFSGGKSTMRNVLLACRWTAAAVAIALFAAGDVGAEGGRNNKRGGNDGGGGRSASGGGGGGSGRTSGGGGASGRISSGAGASGR